MIRAAVLATALVLAGTAHAASVGTYCGELASNGHMDPAETTIIRDDAGNLSGSYQFTDDGQAYRGDLSRGTMTRKGTWHFTWTDNFGMGQLDIRFNSDAPAFDGLWGADKDTPNLPWYGKLGESCLDGAPST